MPDPGPLDLALWGPSGAGKTMLVAQLVLAQHEAATDWEVLTTKESLAPVQEMRAAIVGRNAFLMATGRGNEQTLSYRFRHRKSGWQARLSVEDRAGLDWEQMDPDALQRLKSSKGIVLLFDPIRPHATVEQEISTTLEHLYVDLGETGKDPRPVAVCLTKADTCVRTPADFARATSPSTMHDFAARFLHPRVIAALDRHLATYRLFPMSAAGIRVERGIVEHFTFMDEAFQPRLRTGGQPINLFAPFLWLFDMLGGP